MHPLKARSQPWMLQAACGYGELSFQLEEGEVLMSDTNQSEPAAESEMTESGGRDWSRLLLVILFALIYQVAEVIFFAVALFQVVCMLVTGDRNDRLNEFAGTLTGYIYQVLEYICLRSDVQPWPLGESA